MYPSTTTTTATTVPTLVGLVASGGFARANRRDKVSRMPGLPLVGLVGIGGLVTANRRATIQPLKAAQAGTPSFAEVF
jgi:hypothetical protein